MLHCSIKMLDVYHVLYHMHYFLFTKLIQQSMICRFPYFVLAYLLDRSVHHQPIGVPQTTGFSFQPLQPNILTTPFLTLSSPFQRGHCLWMIVCTLNNAARSWIFIMHQTDFFFFIEVKCLYSCLFSVKNTFTLSWNVYVNTKQFVQGHLISL
jgi:hypothetical protein